jgi:hypothetical protein
MLTRILLRPPIVYRSLAGGLSIRLARGSLKTNQVSPVQTAAEAESNVRQEVNTQPDIVHSVANPSQFQTSKDKHALILVRNGQWPTTTASMFNTGLVASVVLKDLSRDSGVSETIWNQLQADKKSAKTAARTRKRLLLEESNLLAVLEDQSLTDKASLEAAATAWSRKDCNSAAPEHQLYLDAGSKAQSSREEKKKAEQARDAARKAIEDAEKEVAMQEKLDNMGICVMGYEWIKQATGWRCTGGNHFIFDD